MNNAQRVAVSATLWTAAAIITASNKMFRAMSGYDAGGSLTFALGRQTTLTSKTFELVVVVVLVGIGAAVLLGWKRAKASSP